MKSTIKKSIAGWIIATLCFACSPSKSIVHNHLPFTFFILGDWGNKGTGYQIPVANQMIEQSKTNHPSLIITVGDNFYETGVASINDEHWQLSYEKIYKSLTTDYPWYASLGNHDYRGNINAQIEYHSVNPNWNMPAQYYTFVKTTPDHKSVRFIVIDTSPYASDYYSDPKYKNVVSKQDTAKQTYWVDSVLAQSKETWKIVIGHHPLFGTQNEPGQTETLRRTMQPLFDKYKVNAYICGHDHVMQFNQPKQSKVTYIISGGGAKPTEKTATKEYTTFSLNKPGFTICSIAENRFNFKFIDTTGKSMYQYSTGNSLKD